MGRVSKFFLTEPIIGYGLSLGIFGEGLRKQRLAVD